MKKHDKLLIKILQGSSDTEYSIQRAMPITQEKSFIERIRGDHHIFIKDGVEEILNLQPKGTKAKPYQVKQIRKVIIKYKIGEMSSD